MTADELANYAFAYVLIGSVIWMLLYRPVGPSVSRAAVVAASIGTILVWPYVVVEIARGLVRRGRS